MVLYLFLSVKKTKPEGWNWANNSGFMEQILPRAATFIEGNRINETNEFH